MAFWCPLQVKSVDCFFEHYEWEKTYGRNLSPVQAPSCDRRPRLENLVYETRGEYVQPSPLGVLDGLVILVRVVPVLMDVW